MSYTQLYTQTTLWLLRSCISPMKTILPGLKRMPALNERLGFGMPESKRPGVLSRIYTLVSI